MNHRALTVVAGLVLFGCGEKAQEARNAMDAAEQLARASTGITEGQAEAERFYQEDGRHVLHRRYVGPAAGYGDYEHLPADDISTIDDRPYRHWYDTVLLEPSGSASRSES